MPTEDYYKARFTGVADMSKPGAADGLIAHDRHIANRITAQARPVNVTENVKAGEGLGVLIGLALPYLFTMFGGWTLFYKAGIKMDLGTSAATFPNWYVLLTILLPPIAVFMLRKVIAKVFLGLLLVWIGYAIIF